MWDSHNFGSWTASAPADGRLVARFAWTYPQRTDGYAAHLAAQLPARTFDGQLYQNATHRISIAWFDLDDPDALAAAVNEAMLAIIPGVRWSFQAAHASDAFSTLVLAVDASEAYECVVAGRNASVIDFDVLCTPGWRAAEATQTPTGATTLPHVYAIADIPGSIPAPCRVSHTHDQAVTKTAWGIRSGVAALDATQDYQGGADTDALSGQSASLNPMTGSFATIGTPATLDSDDLRGWYIVAARVEQPDASPGDTTWRAHVSTDGDGIAVSETFDSEAVPSTIANAFELVYLGPVPIPAANLPFGVGSAGLGPETADVSQTTHTTDITIAATIQQTFTAGVSAYLSKVRVRLGDGDVTVQIFDSSFGTPLSDLVTVPVTVVDNYDAVFGSMPLLASGTQYGIEIKPSGGGNRTYRYANGAYAGGAATGLGFVAGDDLYFVTYTRTPPSLATTVAIQAKNAGGGIAKLDTVALIPYDEWAAFTEASYAADRGPMLDALGETPDAIASYLVDTTAGHVAPFDQSDVDLSGMPRLWPGDSALVVAAETPDDPPTGGDLIVTYAAMYLTPYGG